MAEAPSVAGKREHAYSSRAGGQVTGVRLGTLQPKTSSNILKLKVCVGHSVQAVPLAKSMAGLSPGRTSKWQAALILLLVGWIYLPVLAKLSAQWWHDPNFSHGFFVPAFSLWVLWEQRKRLAAIPDNPSWMGLPILIFALSMLIVGVLGAELFLSRLSLLLVIAGLVVLFLGWEQQKAILFPWAFLLLMIPIPSILFNEITFPLQLLASKVAAHVLPWMGVPVFREGNIIQLPVMALEVAEACSGIRSLLSLATLAIIYGYVMENKSWIRVMLALASIPIAVAANSLRIVGTGLLVQYWDPEKAEGFFHAFSGWLIFVVSLGMLFALHRLAGMFSRPKRERA